MFLCKLYNFFIQYLNLHIFYFISLFSFNSHLENNFCENTNILDKYSFYDTLNTILYDTLFGFMMYMHISN